MKLDNSYWTYITFVLIEIKKARKLYCNANLFKFQKHQLNWVYKTFHRNRRNRKHPPRKSLHCKFPRRGDPYSVPLPIRISYFTQYLRDYLYAARLLTGRVDLYRAVSGGDLSRRFENKCPPRVFTCFERLGLIFLRRGWGDFGVTCLLSFW